MVILETCTVIWGKLLKNLDTCFNNQNKTLRCNIIPISFCPFNPLFYTYYPISLTHFTGFPVLLFLPVLLVLPFLMVLPFSWCYPFPGFINFVVFTIFRVLFIMFLWFYQFPGLINLFGCKRKYFLNIWFLHFFCFFLLLPF